MTKPLGRPACARRATWRVNWRTAGHKRMLALKAAKIVMPWQRRAAAEKARSLYWPDNYNTTRNCVAL